MAVFTDPFLVLLSLVSTRRTAWATIAFSESCSKSLICGALPTTVTCPVRHGRKWCGESNITFHRFYQFSAKDGYYENQFHLAI